MTLNLYESWRYIKPCEEFENFHLEKKIKERHNKYVMNWNLTNNHIHMEGDKHS
jgi:hypothetical protein